MPLTLDELRHELLSLPSEERESLIANLPQDSVLHSDLNAELRHRAEEYGAGRMTGMSLEEFERELDKPFDQA